MSGFLRQFRKRGTTTKGIHGSSGQQQPREACMDPSESGQSHCSFEEHRNTASSAEAQASKQRRWGRRRKRTDVVAVITISKAEDTKATATPPVTPEKEHFATDIPSPNSTATTASPTLMSEKSADGPFVPEEEVEAVRRALSGEVAYEDDEDAWNAVTHAVAALDKAGNDLFAAGEYDAAFKRYERALQLKRNTLRTQDDKDSEPGRNRHLPESQDSSTSQQQQRADVVASVATSINNMTYLQQRAGLLSADESLASYFKSLQMKRETLGPDHLSVGKTLNNIGSAFYLKKEYEPALQAYRDARRVMEANLGYEHGDVGTVVSNIGDVYFALERSDEALEHYRSALKIRWASLGPSDVKVARLMQRIAAIETGKQPERDGEDSESDTDEYQDADLKAVLFKEDIQSLQEEMEEDMKYFDLVEREMALNMLKDKMRIFREMRELSTDSIDARLLSEAYSPTSVSDGIHQHGPKENSAEPLAERHFGRTRSHSEGSIEASVGANHRRYPKAYAKLSSVDREKALCSVQNRLARLRADRNCVSESSGDDVLTLVECVNRSNQDTTSALLAGSGSPVQRLFPPPRQATA